MRFDHDAYFDAVRDSMFEGSMEQIQVDGQNLILSIWEHGDTGSPMDDIRWLSYSLATVFHETATRCWPIREFGQGAGMDYGTTYYGRGLVQLTWEENYRNASAALGLIGERDLIEHPDLALDSMIAARIMFRGMSEGWFTGAKLGQFFNDTEDNPIDARTIINGHDQDELIAGYHETFLDALKGARQGIA